MNPKKQKVNKLPLDRLNQARGALLGLAVGDAIGTTVEFMPRGSFPPVTDMVGGGPFNLKSGEWTDDTSMALCLASSLLENGFDLDDQMRRYVLWREEGFMSSTGDCFDIGNTIQDALDAFKRTGNAVAGSTDPDTAGNGSIMRLAPIPIHYLNTPKLAVQLSEEQSRTTHQAPECLMACSLLSEILIRALQGKSKEDVLAPSQQVLSLTPRLKSIAEGGYKTKSETEIRSTGYVVDSLEAAFWCFWQTDNFKDCVLLAANLGDDADTIAAISGQIAGACYGETGIPAKWLEKLTMGDGIGKLAEQLAMNEPIMHKHDFGDISQ